MNHPTVPVTICGQTIDVDEKMVRLVTWLNSIVGIRTIGCCQGDENKSAFVSFVAADISSLEHPMRLFEEFSCLFANNTWGKALGYDSCHETFFQVSVKCTEGMMFFYLEFNDYFFDYLDAFESHVKGTGEAKRMIEAKWEFDKTRRDSVGSNEEDADR